MSEHREQTGCWIIPPELLCMLSKLTPSLQLIHRRIRIVAPSSLLNGSREGNLQRRWRHQVTPWARGLAFLEAKTAVANLIGKIIQHGKKKFGSCGSGDLRRTSFPLSTFSSVLHPYLSSFTAGICFIPELTPFQAPLLRKSFLGGVDFFSSSWHQHV